MRKEFADHARLPIVVVSAFLAFATVKAEQLAASLTFEISGISSQQPSWSQAPVAGELVTLAGAGFEFQDIELNTAREVISWSASPDVPLFAPEPGHSLGMVYQTIVPATAHQQNTSISVLPLSIFSPDGYNAIDSRQEILAVPEPATVALAFLAITAFVFARGQRIKTGSDRN